jgi:hypothetical protein
MSLVVRGIRNDGNDGNEGGGGDNRLVVKCLLVRSAFIYRFRSRLPHNSQ